MHVGKRKRITERREMEKIESRFNKWYREVKEEENFEYLRKDWSKKRWQGVARFRVGNEIRRERYWEGEDKKTRRMCGNEEEE